MKLLVVDKDRDLVEMLTAWLRTRGYDVHRAYTLESARDKWIEQKPDMVILDSALDGDQALAVCKDLRNTHDAFVVVVTGEKDVQDEVRCLDAGADDYVRKPFFPSQLLARIRAVSRRARSTLERRPAAVVNVGALCVDLLRNEVRVDGKAARLTATEGKLLHFLAVNANGVCTTEQIISHVWGYSGGGDACLIKAHIYHLRRKIEAVPGSPRYIVTVPGVGYTLVQQLVQGPNGHMEEKVSLAAY